MNAMARDPAAKRDAVQAWAQSVVPPLLRDSGVPGACLAVVTADDVLLLEGFGRTHADGASVDPAGTRFRIGSLTKPMTAMLAVKLAEAGRIDLDGDVNGLLKRVRVPATFPLPVTSRQILRHRAGFAGISMRLQAATAARARMPARDMQRHVRRIRAPGDVPAYDNLGYGLLGIALEDATGRALFDLYRETLFAPLGMKSAILGPPPEDEVFAARGHVLRGDSVHAIRPGHLPLLMQAAGAISATAADMVEFARCILRRGAPLLGESAFRAMVQFQAPHPEAPGIGLGLLESDFAGHRGFGHGGLIDGFTARLAVFPQAGIALFAAFNIGPDLRRAPWLAPFDRLRRSSEGAQMQAALSGLDRHVVASFANRFVPAAAPTTPLRLPRIETSHLAGLYRPTRARTGGMLDRLTHPGVAVSALADGGLRIGDALHVRISDGHFADAAGGHVYFRLAESRALMAQSSTAVYERAA
ncbi:MAG TPA: serine hydrolase domain-containing protein [Rhizomicrobium sp.]